MTQRPALTCPLGKRRTPGRRERALGGVGARWGTDDWDGRGAHPGRLDPRGAAPGGALPGMGRASGEGRSDCGDGADLGRLRGETGAAQTKGREKGPWAGFWAEIGAEGRTPTERPGEGTREGGRTGRARRPSAERLPFARRPDPLSLGVPASPAPWRRGCCGSATGACWA